MKIFADDEHLTRAGLWLKGRLQALWHLYDLVVDAWWEAHDNWAPWALRRELEENFLTIEGLRSDYQNERDVSARYRRISLGLRDELETRGMLVNPGGIAGEMAVRPGVRHDVDGMVHVLHLELKSLHLQVLEPEHWQRMYSGAQGVFLREHLMSRLRRHLEGMASSRVDDFVNSLLKGQSGGIPPGRGRRSV